MASYLSDGQTSGRSALFIYRRRSRSPKTGVSHLVFRGGRISAKIISVVAAAVSIAGTSLAEDVNPVVLRRVLSRWDAPCRLAVSLRCRRS